MMTAAIIIFFRPESVEEYFGNIPFRTARVMVSHNLRSPSLDILFFLTILVYNVIFQHSNRHASGEEINNILRKTTHAIVCTGCCRSYFFWQAASFSLRDLSLKRRKEVL